jgi:hypothetical protein
MSQRTELVLLRFEPARANNPDAAALRGDVGGRFESHLPHRVVIDAIK